jgi:quercetin dioxygenase-like cupin family protein
VSAFKPLAEIAPLPIWTGILARVVEGRDITFAVVELEPHAVAATHQHLNEQIGVVLRGTLLFTIGDERRELHAGDTYEIPSHATHEAVAGSDGAVVIDVFTPIRADWHRHAPHPPQKPVWP